MNQMFGYRVLLGARKKAKIAVVNFNAKSSTGTQTITSSALNGSTPVAAIFSANQGNVSDHTKSDSTHSFGFADGSSSYCLSGSSNNNLSSTDGLTRMTTNVIRIDRNDAGTNLATAAFSAFVENGVTIDWSTASGAQEECAVMLIADCNAAAGLFNPDDTSGNTASETGLGFKPTTGVFLQGPAENAGQTSWSGSETDSESGIGFCDAALNQVIGWHWNDDGVGTTDVRARIEESRIAYHPIHGEAAELTAWDDGGFTVTSRANLDSDFRIPYLVMDCNSYVTTAQISSTGTESVTGASFTPSALLVRAMSVQSKGSTLTSGGEVQVAGSGMASNLSGSIVQGCHVIGSVDGQGTSSEECGSFTDQVFNNLNATLLSISVDSFTSGGVDLTVSGTASGEYLPLLLLG